MHRIVDLSLLFGDLRAAVAVSLPAPISDADVRLVAEDRGAFAGAEIVIRVGDAHLVREDAAGLARDVVLIVDLERIGPLLHVVEVPLPADGRNDPRKQR